LIIVIKTFFLENPLVVFIIMFTTFDISTLLTHPLAPSQEEEWESPLLRGDLGVCLICGYKFFVF